MHQLLPEQNCCAPSRSKFKTYCTTKDVHVQWLVFDMHWVCTMHWLLSTGTLYCVYCVIVISIRPAWITAHGAPCYSSSMAVINWCELSLAWLHRIRMNPIVQGWCLPLFLLVFLFLDCCCETFSVLYWGSKKWTFSLSSFESSNNIYSKGW